MKFPRLKRTKPAKPPNPPRERPPAPAPAPKPPKTAGVLDGRSFGIKVLTSFTAVFALALSAVVALVVIGNQIAFYQETMKTKEIPQLWNLDLTLFTPIATEGIVWSFTLMAVVLVTLNRNSAFWLRSMWLFAGLAAFVNSWHAIGQSDVLGGLATGGLSLAGPFTVHGFVLWVRALASGKTIDETKADVAERWRRIRRGALATLGAVFDHTVHPRVAFRALSIWRGVRQYSYAQAWALAATGYRRQLYRKTVAASLGKPVKDLTDQDLETAPADGAHPHAQGAHDPLPEPDAGSVVGGVRTPEQEGAHQGAHPDARTGAHPELSDLLAQLEAANNPGDLLRAWDDGAQGAQGDAHPDGAQGAHPDAQGGAHGVRTSEPSENEGAHPGAHNDDEEGAQGGAHPDARMRNQGGAHPEGDSAHPDAHMRTGEGAQGDAHPDARTPSDSGADRPAHPPQAPTGGGAHPRREKGAQAAAVQTETGGSMTPKDLAAMHYWRLHHAGRRPEEWTFKSFAEDLGMNRRSATRGYQAADSGEFPDPGPEAFNS